MKEIRDQKFSHVQLKFVNILQAPSIACKYLSRNSLSILCKIANLGLASVYFAVLKPKGLHYKRLFQGSQNLLCRTSENIQTLKIGRAHV